MPQPQPVHFVTEGNQIIVTPSDCDVGVDDTVVFYADDTNVYEVEIPDANNFFETKKSKINETVTKAASQGTPPVKAPVGTQKGYSVTSANGGTTEAPPKIIVVS